MPIPLQENKLRVLHLDHYDGIPLTSDDFRATFDAITTRGKKRTALLHSSASDDHRPCVIASLPRTRQPSMTPIFSCQTPLRPTPTLTFTHNHKCYDTTYTRHTQNKTHTYLLRWGVPLTNGGRLQTTATIVHPRPATTAATTLTPTPYRKSRGIIA